MDNFSGKRLGMRSTTGGALGTFLFTVVLAAAVAFVLTNPQTKEFAQRSFREFVRVLSETKPEKNQPLTPKPSPEAPITEKKQVAAAVAVSPSQTPEATATPEPTVAPTPVPISLADVAADPHCWPKTTRLTREVEFPVVVNGKVCGHVTMPVGHEFKCNGLQGEKVTVEHNGSPIAVPVIATDFFARASDALNAKRQPPTSSPTAESAPQEIAPSSSASREVQSGVGPKTALLEWVEANTVTLKGESIVPAVSRLGGIRYLAIYFASHSDGPCRRMTPALKEFYLKKKAEGASVEFVTVSQDSSASEMESFLREHQLPWPALKWEEVGIVNDLTKYSGGELPGLVLIDANGKFLSSSTQNGVYMGPSIVLEEINKLCVK